MSAGRNTAFYLIIATQIFGISGCAKSPQSMCAQDDTQQATKKIFFIAAARYLDAGAANYSEIDRAEVKADLESLKADNLYAFDYITFEGQDKETRTVRCSATAKITLPPAYKTDRFRSISTELNSTVLPSPPDLFGDDPQVQFEYTVQPSAAGKGNIVSIAPSNQITGTLLRIAITKWGIEKGDAARGRSAARSR